MKNTLTFVLFFLFSGIYAQQVLDISDLKIIEEQLEGDSLNSELLYKSGQIYFSINNFPKAIINFRKAVALDTNKITYKKALGKSLFSEGDYQEAEMLFTKINDKEGYDFVATNYLSKIYISTKKYNTAIETFKDLYKNDIENIYYLQKIAQCFEKIKKNDSAILYYKKAHYQKPKNIKVIDRLVLNYYLNTQIDSSDYYVDKGLEIAPENAILNRRKGNIIYTLKLYKEAIPYYEKAIQSGDSSAFIYKQAGLSHFGLDDYDHYEIAAEMLQKSFDSDSLDNFVASHLGKAYYNSSRIEKGKYYMNYALSNYLKVLPEIADSYQFMAKCHISQEKWDSYFEAKQKEYKYSNDASILLDIGRVYIQKGDKKNARKYLNNFRNEINNAQTKKYYAYFSLAVAYEDINDKKNAIAMYKKSIEISEKEKQSNTHIDYCIDYSKGKIKTLNEELFFEGKQD